MLKNKNGSSGLKIVTDVRRGEIVVDDQVLELREPSIAATHEILELIFDDAFSEGISALSEMLNTKTGDEGLGSWAMANLSSVLKVVKGAVVPLVSRKAGAVAAIVLDTKKNRKAVSMKSLELREWLTDELTPLQTVMLIQGLKDLIDWDELVKHFKALIPNLSQIGEATVPELESLPSQTQETSV